MHALIIEDEELIAMAIEDVLRDCGFTSFRCRSITRRGSSRGCGKDARELITADVELKPGSGIDAVQTICSERANSGHLHHWTSRRCPVADASTPGIE